MADPLVQPPAEPQQYPAFTFDKEPTQFEVSQIVKGMGSADQINPDILRAAVAMYRVKGQMSQPLVQDLRAFQSYHKSHPQKFWKDMWASWRGAQDEEVLKCMVREVTKRGKNLLSRFPLRTWEEVLAMPYYKQQGEHLVTQVWEKQTGVLQDVSEKTPAHQTGDNKYLFIQGMKKKGYNMKLPINFAVTRQGAEAYRSEMEKIGKSAIQTWLFIIEETLVNRGLISEYMLMDQQSKIRLSPQDFANLVKYRNGRCFCMNKSGTGLSGLESQQMTDMVGRGIRPTNVMFGMGALRSQKFIPYAARSYSEAGPKMMDLTMHGTPSLESPMCLTTLGYTDRYNIEIDEGLPFNDIDSNTTYDPLTHTKFCPQFFVASWGMSPLRYDKGYTSAKRNIQILNFDTHRLEEVTIMEMFNHCGIFDTAAQNKFTEWGKKLLIHLCTRDSEASIVGQTIASQNALESERRRRMAGFGCDDEDFKDACEDEDSEGDDDDDIAGRKERELKRLLFPASLRDPDGQYELTPNDYADEYNKDTVDNMGKGINAYNLFRSQKQLHAVVKQILASPFAQRWLVTELLQSRDPAVQELTRSLQQKQDTLNDRHLRELDRPPQFSGASYSLEWGTGTDAPMVNMQRATPQRYSVGGKGRTGSAAVAPLSSSQIAVSPAIVAAPRAAAIRQVTADLFPFYSLAVDRNATMHNLKYPYVQDRVFPDVQGARFVQLRSAVAAVAGSWRHGSATRMSLLNQITQAARSESFELFVQPNGTAIATVTYQDPIDKIASPKGLLLANALSFAATDVLLPFLNTPSGKEFAKALETADLTHVRSNLGKAGEFEKQCADLPLTRLRGVALRPADLEAVKQNLLAIRNSFQDSADMSIEAFIQARLNALNDMVPTVTDPASQALIAIQFLLYEALLALFKETAGDINPSNGQPPYLRAFATFHFANAFISDITAKNASKPGALEVTAKALNGGHPGLAEFKLVLAPIAQLIRNDVDAMLQQLHDNIQNNPSVTHYAQQVFGQFSALCQQLGFMMWNDNSFSADRRALISALVNEMVLNPAPQDYVRDFVNRQIATRAAAPSEFDDAFFHELVRSAEELSRFSPQFKDKVRLYSSGGGKKRKAGVVSSLDDPVSRAKKLCNQQFQITDPRTIERILMRIRLSYRFFEFLFNENLVFPIGFLLFRMAVEIVASSAIFYVKGESTGVLCIRDAHVMYAEEIHPMEMEVQIKFDCGLMIHAPQNISLIPDVYASKYVRGCTLKMMDPVADLRRYTSGQTVGKDIHVFAVHHDYKPKHFYVPMCGQMDPRIYIEESSASGAEEHYSTCQIYRSMWDLPNPAIRKTGLVGIEDDHMWTPAYYNKATSRWPSLAYQGCQKVIKDSNQDQKSGWAIIQGSDELGRYNLDGDTGKIGGVDEFEGLGMEGPIPRHLEGLPN